MSEIKASDEFKSKMITDIKQTTIKKLSYSQRLNRLPLLACTFAVLIILGISFMGNNNLLSGIKGNAGSDNFINFSITAYASDGSEVEIKPNSEFLIGEYQTIMSSAPGFPIKIVCPEADYIKLTAANGEFLLWNPPSYVIQHKGREIEVKSGDKVYWSPSVNDDSKNFAKDDIIQIKAYKDKKAKGGRSINIKSDDSFRYTATLTD